MTALVWDALSRAAAGTIGLLLALAAGRPLVLSALGVESFTVETPDTVTFLFSFVSTPEEISFAVGPGVLAVGAALELYYTFAQSHRRRRRPADEPTDTVAFDR